MNMTAITTYGSGAGSSRVRVFDWLDHFGVGATVESYTGHATNSPRALLREPVKLVRAEARARTLSRRVSGRIALVSRQASPLSRGGLEARTLRAAGHGVYDFDDALHLSQTSKMFPKRLVWQRAVTAADIVIAGNDTLAEAAARYSRDVVVIPSCVEPADYRRKEQYSLAGAPRAVWIGSRSTEAYLRAIAAPLLKVHRSHGLRLTLISSGRASNGDLDAMIDRIEWDVDTFGRHLAEADFGIMPLSDDPWTRGKCAYKLLQYGAAGLPIVGSPVGANRDVLGRGGGLSPESVSDWSEALEQIVQEPEGLRAHRGNTARRSVERHYSFQAWAEVWRSSVGLSR